MYEYVPREEYQPVRLQLESIINKVQDLVRDKFTFQYQLIGSGGHHLITRIAGGNQGFDFDYNLIINNPEDSQIWNPDYIRITFINAFREVVRGTRYSDPNDKTPVIQIKFIDQDNSRIVHSCDFAMIYYPNDGDSHYYKYAKHNKYTNQYTWEERSLSKYADGKVEWIKDNKLWDKLAEEYLKIKNNNKDENKHSFSLYLEAINNIFNYYFEEEDEDDDWD